MKEKTTRPESIDFPKPSYNDWKQAAIDSLNGKSFDKVMFSDTYENFKIKPLYCSEHTSNLDSLLSEIPGELPFNRSNDLSGYKENTWNIYQKFDFYPVSKFNSNVAKVIENNSVDKAEISIIIDHEGIINTDDLITAFSGLDLSNTVVNFSPRLRPESILNAFDDIDDCLNTSINIEFDPYSELLTKGNNDEDIIDTWSRCSEHLTKTDTIGSSSIAINVKPINRGGANITQELAYAISMGCEVIAEMLSHGHDINTVANRIRFHFAIGSDFFFEIAKFRTARILWAKIIKEFGGHDESAKMNIFAESGKNNKSCLDVHTNILRTTGEAFAAILGGVNSLYLEPFDKIKGESSNLSRRIARNIQLVIKEETHITDTIDPAAGSWYIDALTKELSEAAWREFQSIESKGGFINALKKGIPQAKINVIAESRIANFTKRKETLIGVNIFPNLLDKDFSRAQKTKIDTDTIIKPIPELNLPEMFEELRSRSERYKTKTGKLPIIHILQFGRLRDYKARSDFAVDYFKTGGFETAIYPAFESYSEASKWIFDNDIENFVICSSDELYKGFVPQLCELVKKLKPLTKIILAGDPDINSELNTLFIDEFIYLRSNIYETLNRIQMDLEIK